MASIIVHTSMMMVLVLVFISQVSYARLLDEFQPGLNIALPMSEDGAISSVSSPPSIVLPCDLKYSTNGGGGEVSHQTQKLHGKYGPLVLNMLPKGEFPPPSGPSKGTNSLGN